MVSLRLLKAAPALRGLALVAGALAVAGAAAAQTPPPPATFGPPIAGLCLFARGAAVARSQVGVSAEQQLSQFAQGIDAELKAQATAIHNDDHALLGQKASLPAAEYQQRVNQLRQRISELEHTRALRGAQLALTRKDALAQIGKILEPGMNETITARRCSVVFEGTVAYGSADAMDITPAVIQRMDAMQTVVALRLATPEAAQAAAQAAAR
jgi:outer membrane protein